MYFMNTQSLCNIGTYILFMQDQIEATKRDHNQNEKKFLKTDRL